MRARKGNFFSDAHKWFVPNWTARCYDFVTFPDRSPADIAIAIEEVAESVGVPDLCLYGRGKLQKQRRYDRNKVNLTEGDRDYGTHWFEEVVQMPMGNDVSKWNQVNGAIFTSWRQDEQEAEPALHVAFLLYDVPCANTKCLAGHMGKLTGIAYTVAPALTNWQLEAIEEEIGVHPSYRLGGPHDSTTLSTLGFTPLDCPLIGSKVGTEDIHTALDYLARTDIGAFAYKSRKLLEEGYPIDLGLVHAMAIARRIN